MEQRLNFILLLALVIVSSAAKIGDKMPCNLTYQCPTEENVVWASDGNTCEVFGNRCLLNSENCDRQNKYKTMLRAINKVECQKLCRSECPEDNNPVCGYFKDKISTFPNQCEMENHVCKTGESIAFFGIGSC